MASRKNGRTVDAVILPGKNRGAPRKPSEAQYVRLPDDQPAELFEFTDEPQAGQYMDAALQGVMMELGERDDQAKVTVRRITITQGIKKEEWLFECHPREFSLPHLQEYYGAGDFRVTVYGQQDGSNYKVVHADKKISIGEMRGAAEKKAAALAGIAGAAVAPAQDVQRAVAEALSAPLTALAQVIAQAMPKASSRADTFAEFRQMAELMALMRGPAQAGADPLQMLGQVMALMKNATPAAAPLPLTEDGDLSPNFLLSRGIELVQTLLARHNGALPAGAAEQAQLPAPAAPGAPTTPAANIEDNADVKLALRMQLAFLLNAASMDSTPETYAALIYEQAPDEIIAILKSEQWFAALQALEPKFAEFKPWAEKVRAEVLQMLAEDADVLTDGAKPGTTSGDANSAAAPAGAPPIPGNVAGTAAG